MMHIASGLVVLGAAAIYLALQALEMLGFILPIRRSARLSRILTLSRRVTLVAVIAGAVLFVVGVSLLHRA